MFGRTLKVAAILVLTQLSAGCCCCCCYRPFFCHPFCGGGCGAAAPCCVVRVGLHAHGRTVGPDDCSAADGFCRTEHDAQHAAGLGFGCQPDRRITMPFSSATYTHPIR